MSEGMRNPPPVNSEEWRSQVQFMLKGGHGVEDIAIFLRCRVDQVRSEVARLRSSGALARWWQ